MMNKEEFEFLQWFYHNVDFGPAHEDIMRNLHEYYVEDTGFEVPENYKLED